MSFYERMGITPLINASETYTNLGGSLMDPRTFQAMQEAGKWICRLSAPAGWGL